MTPEEKHLLIDRNLTSHAATAEAQTKFEIIRDRARDLAHHIENICPDGREKSLAQTKIEEAVFFAVASIARNQ